VVYSYAYYEFSAPVVVRNKAHCLAMVVPLPSNATPLRTTTGAPFGLVFQSPQCVAPTDNGTTIACAPQEVLLGCKTRLPVDFEKPTERTVII